MIASALLVTVLAITPAPTPGPLPTPHIECIPVPVPSHGPCYCCSRITWRNWHRDREPERLEAPISCDCGGAAR